ncbi:MAG TPA: DUF2339 domain-containing protein [Candidatus Limnocylindrales bacterium]|nr:DUF2339 domain-containing protein [Candidatus Limnocylindrales bacterium]
MVAILGIGALALLLGVDARFVLVLVVGLGYMELRLQGIDSQTRRLKAAVDALLVRDLYGAPVAPASVAPASVAPTSAEIAPAIPIPPPSVAPIPTPPPAASPITTPLSAAPLRPAGPSLTTRILRAIGLGTDWRSDIEAWLAGRLLAVVGGVAVVAGAAFFLSLAFSRGWIGPEGRVLIGLAAGAALIGLSAWLFERRYDLLAHVIVAVGLGVTTLAMFAATRLFELVPVEIGLGGSMIAAVAAAVIAIRNRSQVVAGFGLVAVLAAPPILGASPTLTTLGFMAVALAGITAISLYRTWTWLPPVAFVLAAPQLASYIVGDPAPALALIALGGFWVLNAVAAAGEELRTPSGRLRTSSASLLVVNAAFLVWGSLITLDGPLFDLRAAFLAVVAAAHLVLGGRFLLAEGDRHPFGMLATGTGLAALAMAVPVQAGGPPVPIAWAAEAVAVAWVATQRRHPYGAAAAALLGLLAVFHLAFIEYPLGRATVGFDAPQYPFIGPAGLTLAFELGAMAVVAGFVRVRVVRVVLAAVGALLVTEAVGFELSGHVRLAAWIGLAVLAIAAERRLVRVSPRLPALDQTDDVAVATAVGERTLYAVASIAGLAAVVHALTSALSPMRFVGGLAASFPGTQAVFPDAALITASLLIVGALATGVAWGTRVALWRSALAAGFVVAWLLPFELPPAASVVGWSALAVVGLVADRTVAAPRLAGGWTGLGEGAFALVALAAGLALAVVAPPSRLFVSAASVPVAAPFVTPASAALLAVGVGLAAIAWWASADRRIRQVRLAGGVGAGVAGVYLLSIGVVDVFARQIGGPIAVEELSKQAQVGISVLWAVLGGGAFVVALVRPMADPRRFGLALLGVATAKVFLFDLAALDVAYRVLSFVGLGVLLLASAYLYRRLQPSGSADRPS